MDNERLRPGTYTARGVPGTDRFDVKEKGVQVAFQLELETGARVTTRLAFSEKAKPYSLDRLRAMGAWITGRPGAYKLEGIDTNLVQATVKYETYQGKEQMRVDIYTGGGSGDASDADVQGLLGELADELPPPKVGGRAVAAQAAASAAAAVSKYSFK
jgi:hypothetical protein